MADLDGLKVAKNYHLDVAFANESFYVKGAGNLDWGMKKHLANIFNEKSGNTVMFAFDYGYSKVINAGIRYSIPTMGVVAVGKDMERTDKYFKLATPYLQNLV